MAREDTKAGQSEGGSDIEQQIRQLRDDVAALAKSLHRYGAQTAEGVKARALDATDDALADALKSVKDLRGEVDAMQTRVEHDVRAHPLAWLVAALGLGLLIGILFSHRD